MSELCIINRDCKGTEEIREELINARKKVEKAIKEGMKMNIPDDEDKIYYIGYKCMAFDFENDLKTLILEITAKITHIPTRNKLLEQLDILCGAKCTIRNSLLEDLAISICGYTYDKDRNMIILDEEMYNVSKASVEEKIEFCIQKWRKCINVIRKALKDNDIDVKIISGYFY